MSQYFYGDPEISLSDLERDDLGLGSLDDKLSERGEFKGFFGKVKKFFKGIFDPGVVYVSGDFMGHDAYERAAQASIDVLNRMKSGDYEGFIELSGDDETDLRSIFNRVVWDESLSGEFGSIAGFYSKVFNKLEHYSRKYGVKFAFVLGNHDQRYSDFKGTFERCRVHNKWRDLYFVDRDVKRVGGLFGYIVAGVGGSEERMANHGDLGLSNAEECIEAGSKPHDELLNRILGRYKDVQTILFHKAYESPAESFKYGVKPEGVIDMGPIPRFNEDLVLKLDELGLLYNSFFSGKVLIGCGHWHAGGLFKKKGFNEVYCINPGEKKIIESIDSKLITPAGVITSSSLSS